MTRQLKLNWGNLKGLLPNLERELKANGRYIYFIPGTNKVWLSMLDVVNNTGLRSRFGKKHVSIEPDNVRITIKHS